MINPYYEEKDIKLYYGDCVEVMKGIEKDSIDFILTDPPFNVGLDYETIDDEMKDEDYYLWCKKWVDGLFPLLKEGHYCIIFTGDKKVFYIMKSIMESGFTYHHFLKWYKPTCQRALSGTVFFGRVELAFVLSRGKPDTKLINRTIMYQDIIMHENTTPRNEGAVDHEARRPMQLYQKIIKGFTQPGDTVLDPFVGSGTTLLACKESKRKGMGIEISEEYCKMAKERIENLGKYELFR